MRNKILYTLLLLMSPLWLLAQNPNGNYNPYVNNGTISPSPIWPLEANGTGTVQFIIGNSGSDPLEVFGDQQMILTLTLSYGEPDHAEPILAVGGTAAELFSWRFNNNTFSGKQTGVIPAGYTGTIEIAYKVTQNSSSPGLNGFNVNIAPAAYQTESNSQDDDAVSSYTYTEIRDYGDAPASYGSAWHIIDFKNYLGSLVDGEQEALFSVQADGDDLDNEADEDGIAFPEVIEQGEAMSFAVAITGVGYLSGWIDWNADGDFADAGEQIVDNVGYFTGIHDLELNVPVDVAINTPLFARFRFSHETVSGYEGGGDEGEVEDYMITISASPNAPSIPENLQAEHNSQDVVALSWSASTDDVGVEGYTVYRDNTELAITSGLNYSDNTVETNNSYTYSVSAFDADGFKSERSPGITIEVLDITAPSVPGNLAIISQTENSVTLGWTASTDNIEVTGYSLYRDGTLIESIEGISYTDNSVLTGNSYNYNVTALDEAGNESDPSGVLLVEMTSLDTDAPSVPEGLSLQVISSEIIRLSWNASMDNIGVTGYNIYRDNELLKSTFDITYTDSTIVSGNTYEYSVSAYDSSGNESELSLPVSVSSADDDPPTIPSGLRLLSVGESGASLAWNHATDNVGVANYNVYKDGDLHGTVPDTSILDTQVELGHTYTYRVSAMDAVGNESAQSEPVTITLSSSNYVMACQLSIHPNPSRGEFILRLDGARGDFIIEIISPVGSVVLQKIIQMKEQLPEVLISLPDYPPGLYNIRVYRDDSIYFGKLMIIH